MSKETKRKHNKNVKNKSSLHNGYKFSGKRYFNANKQLSTKSRRQYVKQNTHTKSKQPNKEVDLYQSHLPETPGYIDSSIKANEDTESADRARTLQLTQEDILRQSDLVSASKRFELKLPNLGPYFINYSRSGRYLLIGGNKGHVASIDWMSKKLTCEFQLKETVRAVQFLHNENMFAVAQKKYVYIYDKQGIELHCLKTHHQVCGMDFLPYHFLLVSVNKRGFLQYTDTSTGEQVANICTRMGRTHCLTHNTNNGIVHVGHSNGTVTLWSPNTPQPLVKMLCHRGPVKSMVIDREGHYMITGGVDSKVRIWDVRTYKSLGEITHYSPATTMCLSQRNVLAIGYGTKVTTYHEPFSKDTCTPFLKHYCDDVITSMGFCPYEDVLGVGHGVGLSSILIPGSAEPNIDSLEANPYQTKSQRREHEVKMLLEKIQPELIALKADSIKLIADMTGEELEVLKQKGEEEVKTAKKNDFKKRGKFGALKQMNIMEKRAKKQEISFQKQREARKKSILKKRDILEGKYSVLERFK